MGTILTTNRLWNAVENVRLWRPKAKTTDTPSPFTKCTWVKNRTKLSLKSWRKRITMNDNKL